MNTLLQLYLGTIVALLLMAGVCHLIGMVSRRLGDVLCRAPMVDDVREQLVSSAIHQASLLNWASHQGKATVLREAHEKTCFSRLRLSRQRLFVNKR